MARCASMISADRHAGKIELNGKRFRKEPRIALRDAGTASGSDLDIDNPLRFQSAQSVARDDPAHFETLGQILLGAEKIAGTQRLGKQRLAHLAHDTRREGSAAKGKTFRSLSLMAGWTLMTFSTKMTIDESFVKGAVLTLDGHPTLHSAGPHRERPAQCGSLRQTR